MRPHLAAVLCGQLGILAALFTVVLDQYAHKRVQSMGGVNTWGYRGPIVPGRLEREIRIAVVGGDHAFGWGVAPGETTTGYLQQLVQASLPASGVSRVVRAVNLGALGLPARDYATRIEQFRYLAPDVMCLYVDSIDRRPAATLPPADSVVTALTGYVPTLPLVLNEKGRMLAERGRRVLGSLLSAAGRVLRAADRAVYGAWRGEPDPTGGDRRAVLEKALDAALSSARAVVVVLPMPFTPEESAAHAEWRTLFQARAMTEPRMRVVDLARFPRLADPVLRLDDDNFGAGGHSLAAEAIAPAVSAFIMGSPVVP